MNSYFKKSTYFSVFIVMITLSLSLLSCSDNNAYKDEIKKADAFLKVEKLEEAKAGYINALKFNKGDVYSSDQIKKINSLLEKKVNDSYSAKIKEADLFLEKKEYLKAQNSYSEAAQLKPSEAYPKTKISDITAIIEKNKVKNSTPYHIIVGSYTLKSNAINLQKNLSSKGTKSTIIRGRNGNHLVSIKSFTTLNKAYNYLAKHDNSLQPNSWVYKQ